MAPIANPSDDPDDPDDAAALAAHSAALVDAVAASVPGWVERCVVARWSASTSDAPSEALIHAAAAAGVAAREEVVPELRGLLLTDVDAQRSNPLALLRAAIRHPARVLEAVGVPPVARDADAHRLFPDDLYDLTPASFAEIDPSLHEPGLVWGAAKAHVILARRRRGR